MPPLGPVFPPIDAGGVGTVVITPPLRPFTGAGVFVGAGGVGTVVIAPPLRPFTGAGVGGAGVMTPSRPRPPRWPDGAGGTTPPPPPPAGGALAPGCARGREVTRPPAR